MHILNWEILLNWPYIIWVLSSHGSGVQLDWLHNFFKITWVTTNFNKLLYYLLYVISFCRILKLTGKVHKRMCPMFPIQWFRYRIVYAAVPSVNPSVKVSTYMGHKLLWFLYFPEDPKTQNCSVARRIRPRYFRVKRWLSSTSTSRGPPICCSSCSWTTRQASRK